MGRVSLCYSIGGAAADAKKAAEEANPNPLKLDKYRSREKIAEFFEKTFFQMDHESGVIKFPSAKVWTAQPAVGSSIWQCTGAQPRVQYVDGVGRGLSGVDPEWSEMISVPQSEFSFGASEAGKCMFSMEYRQIGSSIGDHCRGHEIRPPLSG